MRLVSLDSVIKNMQLGRTIYSADGKILLAEGVTLTDKYISRLRELGISSVYIIDHRIGKLEIDDLISEQTRVEAIKITKDTMNKVSLGQEINGEKVRKMVNEVLDELILNRNSLANLVEIRALNDYTFSHSFAVCLLSVVTGLSLGYDYLKLKQLGTGALMHDVGKALTPSELLNKPERLTQEEFAEIQKHSQLGFDILRKSDNISILSAHVAWQHHERYNGTGYPRGLKGKEIHEFARIVAIADTFDALTTDRVYRKKLMPSEVMEYLKSSGGTYYDPDIITVFLKNIAPYPVGSTVLLSNGEAAIIAKATQPHPDRPQVLVIKNTEGNPYPEPLKLNLIEQPDINIVRNLEENEVARCLL